MLCTDIIDNSHKEFMKESQSQQKSIWLSHDWPIVLPVCHLVSWDHLWPWPDLECRSLTWSPPGIHHRKTRMLASLPIIEQFGKIHLNHRLALLDRIDPDFYVSGNSWPSLYWILYLYLFHMKDLMKSLYNQALYIMQHMSIVSWHCCQSSCLNNV